MIDGFDVEGLARQLEELRAGYFLLSIGQNSGYFLAPNPTYDRITGITPSKCSRRDLVSDMADALAKRGIRMMVYLPSGAPAGDEAAVKALEWNNGPFRNREFQQKWEAVIGDWSKRWGKKVSGWWFDGCYWPNHMYRGEAPNFETFAAAARAGNPDSIVAFNPGVFYPVWPMTQHQDFTAGEVSDLTRDLVRDGRMRAENGRYDGKADGVQLHVLSFVGETWGHAGPAGRRDPFGEARLTARELVGITTKVLAYGGAFTWDVPVERNGRIPREFMSRLGQLGNTLDTMAVTFGGQPRRKAE
jgi:alpha-L-fucosidase